MKSDVILINNQGRGFRDAVDEAGKVADYQGLTKKESLHLQLFTEEMLSLARIVTGEMEASFWIENEGKCFDLHMSTETVMDKEKRYLLTSSASSRKNDAAESFLGRLRDAFETAMLADKEQVYFDLPLEVEKDLPKRIDVDPEWDRYEKSVLRKLADNVRIEIRGGKVDMIIRKDFSR